MNYAFQRPFNALDAEGFQFELLKGTDAFAGLFLWPAYFPGFFRGVSWMTGCLPGWFIRRFMKPFALLSRSLDVSEIDPTDAVSSTLWLTIV